MTDPDEFREKWLDHIEDTQNRLQLAASDDVTHHQIGAACSTLRTAVNIIATNKEGDQ